MMRTIGWGDLFFGNLAHDFMEGQAEHLDVEANGIAGEISFRPAPVTVFDDETGIKETPNIEPRTPNSEWVRVKRGPPRDHG